MTAVDALKQALAQLELLAEDSAMLLSLDPNDAWWIESAQEDEREKYEAIESTIQSIQKLLLLLEGKEEEEEILFPEEEEDPLEEALAEEA